MFKMWKTNDLVESQSLLGSNLGSAPSFTVSFSGKLLSSPCFLICETGKIILISLHCYERSMRFIYQKRHDRGPRAGCSLQNCVGTGRWLLGDRICCLPFKSRRYRSIPSFILKTKQSPKLGFIPTCKQPM